MSAACPNCGSRAIEQHDASGSCVCTECGVVVEENLIVSSVEFVEGAGGASSMVGQFVSATSSKAFTGGPGRGGRFGFSRDSRETILANGRRKIQEVASRMRLGNHYIDSAHRLFSIAVEKNFVQGRRTTHIVAACLYISCRQEKSQHMLIDFSDALQVNVYTLGACFLRFRRLLGLKLEIIDPALYIYRFAAHLDLDDKANAVALTALRLVGRMKRDWIVAGRRPAGICAAALLIAARAHGFSRNPEDVTRILRVCGLTVNSRVREFEQTQSALLTLEQFNKVELETEADPPVFTKNRIKEARAKAIQENDVTLLQSGALDHPLVGGKNLSKWRSMKNNKKTIQFDDLYKNLETDLTPGQQRELANADISDDVDADADPNTEIGVGVNNVAATASANANMNADTNTDADVEKMEVIGADETDTNVGKAMDESGTDEVEDGDKKLPAHVSPTETTALTSTAPGSHKLTTVASEWKKAYPKSRLGRGILLPSEYNAEERQPPLIPVEARLDFGTWKDELPVTFQSEVDSMFRDPKEVAQKEAIFNKINKDYLHLQALKDNTKHKNEHQQTEEEKDMLEQAKGHERYRRKRNRKSGDGDATTEEALMEVVSNRKISRKINYDAMSAIFDNEGSFSTDGAGGAEADPAAFEF